MEMDEKKPDMHSIVDIDGFIANGKQFDLEITLATDHRDVIFGVVKDCFKEPVKDAVVKLVEVEHKYGKKEIKPVSHTFTDKEGEFVFGPLCPDKKYAIQIWKDDVKHIKICARTRVDVKCLKGVDIDCDKHFKPCDKDHDKEHDEDHDKDYDKNHDRDKCECKDKHDDRPSYMDV